MDSNNDFDKTEILDRFGKQLVSKRDKAVQARKKSGIEKVWTEDDEYYAGIDDANRDSSNAILNKEKIERNAPLNRERQKGSNVFINITKQYVDVSAYSISDMLLPVDEANYEIRPTPKPSTMDLLKAKPVDVGVVSYKNQQMPIEAFESLIMSEAKKKAEEAQKQINDWLTESNWHREVREVIKDAAKIGTGVMKGCYPVSDSKKSIHDLGDSVMAIAKKTEIKPASRRIDPRDFFPDPACRENIHNGSYIWERDYITSKQLRALKNDDSYISSQIEKILSNKNDYFSKSEKHKDTYEIWYYYGEAKRNDLESCNVSFFEEDDNDVFDVIVVMVNDRVIKATLNPLNNGEFPYDVMVWQKVTDTWTGIGVARHVREPQRIVNAATRNLLDNAGKGGRPTLLIADGVEAVDGKQIVVGDGMLLRVSPDAKINDARAAIASVTIPIITQDLMAIIQYAMKLAEDVTGMPMMLQGQQGSAPNTVGGMTILQNNSGIIRRNIARNFDNMITIPHITRYYNWIMLYGDEECKGDFNIEARGSTALFERDAQHQAILQMGNMVMNPAFQINPAKWIIEAFKAQHLDPERFRFTEEEIKQQQAQAAQNPPQDPKLQIEQMKMQGAMQIEQAKTAANMELAKFNQSTDIADIQVREQLAMEKIKFDAEQNRLEREHIMQLKMLERDLKIMELSQQSQLSIAQIKAQLAQTSQKLNIQTALSKQSQIITPPTEPYGRAENGHAFEQ